MNMIQVPGTRSRRGEYDPGLSHTMTWRKATIYDEKKAGEEEHHSCMTKKKNKGTLLHDENGSDRVGQELLVKKPLWRDCQMFQTVKVLKRKKEDRFARLGNSPS